MSISTYSELKTAIANWLHADDLTSRIPEFIVYAETIIANDPSPSDMNEIPGVRVKDMVTIVDATADSEFLELPTGYLGMVNFKVTTDPEHELTYVHPTIFASKYADALNGMPLIYTLKGDQLQLRNIPTASDSYTVEMAYYKKYTAFSADGDTNWLLTNHPFVYLYGSLIAAGPYIKTNELQIWKNEYVSLVKGLNNNERKQRTGPSPAMRTSRPTP